MKKFLLILTLILSFSIWAQETNCTIPPPHVSESSSRCPEGVAISISDFFYPQATQISVEITEVLSASTDFYMLPPDSGGFTTDIYSEGEYTVTLIIIETIPDTGENIECRSNPIPINVGTCADLDNDNDTYTADVDCNDENPNTYPGAPEVCDREDNDCNGSVDEGLEFKDYYWDADLDGYGNPNLIAPNRCSHPGGRYVEIAGDCNDQDSSINPGAAEVCGDEIDNNCNEQVDEDCNCIDSDGDTVCDTEDVCPGFDDLDNADGDEFPDGCDACFGDNASGDSDSDGVCDSDDGCPNDTSKTAPGDCGCGVADTDSDGDLTPDCNDACPDDINKTEPGDCGCNVADTDSDGDLSPDCNDACPNDINKTEPGDCGCNVADTDSDGDLTPDCNDACPNDINKTEPGDCGCGAVETGDSDGDGVDDCIDNCPNISNPNQEDINDDGIGDACEDCPDSDGDGICNNDDICEGSDDLADADGDTIPDGCDNCPNLSNPNQEPDGDCDGVFPADDCDDNDPAIGSDANDAEL